MTRRPRVGRLGARHRPAMARPNDRPPELADAQLRESRKPMKKTYRGSCRCGNIRFESDIDLSEGTGKCNCTYCWKARWWGAGIKPDAFRLLAGQERTGYAFPTEKYVTRALCTDCGITPFGWGHIPQAGGEFVTIHLACHDDLDPAELIAAPVRYRDGKNDNWWHPAAETRHLAVAASHQASAS